MSPKKAPTSSTVNTNYDEELSPSGKWMNLDAIPENSLDLVGVLTDAGWAPYAQIFDEWFRLAYEEFWFNTRETEDGIVGTVADREYLIS